MNFQIAFYLSVLLVGDSLHINFAGSLVVWRVVVVAGLREAIRLGRADAETNNTYASQIIMILILKFKRSKVALFNWNFFVGNSEDKNEKRWLKICWMVNRILIRSENEESSSEKFFYINHEKQKTEDRLMNEFKGSGKLIFLQTLFILTRRK